MPDTTKHKRVWLEEFKCGCTNVVAAKRDAIRYCPTHGADRIRIISLLTDKKLALGLDK